MSQKKISLFLAIGVVVALAVFGVVAYKKSSSYVPSDAGNDPGYEQKRARLERARQNIKKFPTGYYYNELGLAWYEFGEDARAVEAYKTSLDLDPEYWVVYLNLGNVYLRMGQFAQAERTWQDGVATRPNRPLLHRALIDMYENWDERLLVLEDAYKNALKDTENDPNILHKYIAFLEANNRASEAEPLKKLVEQKRDEQLEKIEDAQEGIIDLEIE